MRYMQLQKELHLERKQIELERATDVRWCSKSGLVSKTLQLLDVVLECLAEFSEESGPALQSTSPVTTNLDKEVYLFARDIWQTI